MHLYVTRRSGGVVRHPFCPSRVQYFQSRLNTTEWVNGTVEVRKEYYFNNWMTLLSQLPLLLFTLLNSILYQR